VKEHAYTSQHTSRRSIQARNQGWRRGRFSPCKFFAALEKCVGHNLELLDIYCSLNILAPSQKTFLCLWCPKLVAGLVVFACVCAIANYPVCFRGAEITQTVEVTRIFSRGGQPLLY